VCGYEMLQKQTKKKRKRKITVTSKNFHLLSDVRLSFRASPIGRAKQSKKQSNGGNWMFDWQSSQFTALFLMLSRLLVIYRHKHDSLNLTRNYKLFKTASKIETYCSGKQLYAMLNKNGIEQYPFKHNLFLNKLN